MDRVQCGFLVRRPQLMYSWWVL